MCQEPGFSLWKRIKYRMEISTLWEWFGLGSTSGNPGFVKYGMRAHMCARFFLTNSYSGAQGNLCHQRVTHVAPQYWFLKPFSRRSQKSSEKWLITGLQQRRYKISLEHSIRKKVGAQKNDGSNSKEHRRQSQRVPTDEIQENLSIKIPKRSSK